MKIPDLSNGVEENQNEKMENNQGKEGEDPKCFYDYHSILKSSFHISFHYCIASCKYCPLISSLNLYMSAGLYFWCHPLLNDTLHAVAYY